jgi:hypothetical protein
MADSNDIQDAAATNAARGLSSTSVDGRSASALSPLTQLDVADRVARNEALEAAESDGKKVSRILGARMRPRMPGAT